MTLWATGILSRIMCCYTNCFSLFQLQTIHVFPYNITYASTHSNTDRLNKLLRILLDPLIQIQSLLYIFLNDCMSPNAIPWVLYPESKHLITKTQLLNNVHISKKQRRNLLASCPVCPGWCEKRPREGHGLTPDAVVKTPESCRLSSSPWKMWQRQGRHMVAYCSFY